MSADDPYERVRAALDERGTPLRSGKALCPAHDDENPSLSVSRGEDRGLVLHCHAGCKPVKVLRALDLPRDLLDAAPVTTGPWHPVARYPYLDPRTGKRLFVQVRQERGTEKRFRSQPANVQQRLLRAETLPLYNQHLLAEARESGTPVYLVEGEGNADRLNTWAEAWDAPDVLAVSHCNGAKNWKPFYAKPLAGLDVTVVVDRDAAGDAWAQAVRRDLEPVAGSLRFVQSATTGKGDDIVDHLDAGHGLGDLVPWDPDRAEAAELEKLVQERKQRLRVEQRARAEVAAEGWEPPTDHGTLEAQLAGGVPAAEYVVEGCLPLGANVLLSAQYKTGKTTAALNVARALTDGEALFGAFAVTHGAGRVAWWNCELDQRTALRWLAEMEFARPDRLHVEHLRGRAVPLRSEAVRDWAVERLRRHQVRTWIVDPFGAVFDGDENSNTDVREWLAALDEIKVRAGVDNVLIVAHTGHAQAENDAVRARGATRLMDWGDALWSYKGGTDAAPDRRWFSAYGRDVQVAETALDFDPATRTLRRVTGAASRASEERSARAREAALAVREHHAIHGTGMTKSALEAALRGDTNRKRQAIQEAVDCGWIKTEPGKNRAVLHWPGDDPDHYSIADFRPRVEAQP